MLGDLRAGLCDTGLFCGSLTGRPVFWCRTRRASLIASVDPDQIQQVLTNLMVNAIQAMPDGGAVQVAIRRERARPPEDHEADQGDYFCIEVKDEGEGIPQEDLPHLFEPFFTTKEVGEGTGLGLSIAYGIVLEHGGWIDVASQPGQGSRFLAYLPQESST